MRVVSAAGLVQLGLGAVALWAALVLASAYGGSARQTELLEHIPLVNHLVRHEPAPQKEAEAVTPRPERRPTHGESLGPHRS